MYQEQKLYIGKSGEEKVYIYPKMANRHGLIAGATGTGKTVSLRVLAESFSDCGVSVFLADAKGDLASMSLKGTGEGSVGGRVEKLGLEKEGFAYHAYPVTFWDVFGEKGLPLRTTITEMGPLLLSRILNLNDTQSDILTIIFKIADDEGLLLIDTKDLRAMLQYVSENAKELSLTYGNIAKQSLTAIIRAVITLEEAGGEQFFGEPALSIGDWIGTDCDGKGKIQILDCQKLMQSPKMYSTFLLWLMSELYETLPEAGDLPKPKMVFFFDEAHMLFDTANRALLEKIEQVVKLIRSKGVGIYFITQNPKDIPDGVLSQLGNKIQHALHAYTPGEQKGAKAAAQAFRENPEFNTYEVLQELAIGEALVSVLNEEGIPTVVKKCTMLPPQSNLGTLDDRTREEQIRGSMLYSKYNEYFDRDSAYEFLQRMNLQAQKEAEEAAAQAAAQKEEAARQKEQEKLEAAQLKTQEKEQLRLQKEQEKEALRIQKAKEKEEEAKKKKANRVAGSVARSAAGTVGRELGNSLGKSIGGSFGKRLGGNVGASLGRGIMSTLFKL